MLLTTVIALLGLQYIRATEITVTTSQPETSSKTQLLAVNSQSSSEYIRSITAYFRPSTRKTETKGKGTTIYLYQKDREPIIKLHKNSAVYYWVTPNPDYRAGAGWWSAFTHCAQHGWNGYWYFNL